MNANAIPPPARAPRDEALSRAAAPLFRESASSPERALDQSR